MMGLAEWRAARLAALTAPDGWLNLTDRVEFSSLPQTVGSSPDNDIRLSSGPARLGRLLDGYRFETATGIRAFTGDGNPMLEIPPFLLEIHTADRQPALRVRDLTLPRAITLRYFPPSPEWVIRARWEAVEPRPQAVEQKGAATTTVTLTHQAHFTHQGLTIILLATHWKARQPMFVIRDQTSGHQTYAAARFLLGEDMSDSEVTLDFNKAHNPPCAFTDFAICPLPPKQNILPFAVEAGERAP